MQVRLGPLALLLALVVAGCSGGGGGDDDAPADFTDLKGTATETTGVIRGVVVDERIIPVPGATVALTGTSSAPNQTTDPQGRFLFSQLQPGTYFLAVSSPLHMPQQTSAEVVAGVDEPEITKVQLTRLFTQEPFSVQVDHEGFFTCSQAGASPWYSSSNCVDGAAGGTVTDLYPDISNATDQDREWHADVGPGWQSIVFEMVWDPTSDSTSQAMGMVVSTYKPTRDGAHQFAEFEGATPIRGQIDVGVEHESAQSVEPTMIPAEGMTNMSFFVSVRPPEGAVCPFTCIPPGVAYSQKFHVYVTMFHYGKPPEGWSFVNGDPLPF